MRLPVRDLIEFAGLLLVVAVVWLATGLLWATVLAGAVVLLYLSHAWVWEDVEVKRVWERKKPEAVPERPKPIVSNRRVA